MKRRCCTIVAVMLLCVSPALIIKLTPFFTKSVGQGISIPLSNNVETRAASVKRRCETWRDDDLKLSDSRRRLLIFRPLMATFCYVPKAGCTFWKRVFVALQTRWTTDIFSLKKQPTHMLNITGLHHVASFDDAHNYLVKSKKFLFVRDPYARLYSAYVDKFLLGDFWRYGSKIVRYYRKNSSNDSAPCAHDVTFTEFLRMATNWNLHSNDYNDHWLPIFTICRPCVFDYSFIGKVETFDEDRDAIIERLGIYSYINTNISHDDTAVDAIVQTINQFWDKDLQSCLTREDYIKRIFRSFKIQGYIPAESTLNTFNITRDEFSHLVISLHKRHRLSLRDWNRQRRKALVDAYAKVSEKVKLDIAKVYKDDFEFFGYEKYPKDLYNL